MSLRGSIRPPVELGRELARDPFVALGVDEDQGLGAEQPDGVAEIVLAEPGSEVGAGAVGGAELERPGPQAAEQVLLAGRADGDHPGDRLAGRGAVDRDEAAHARTADADPLLVDLLPRAEEARHPADVRERLGGHLVGRVPVAALVVGERRPARGRAGAAEVAVV